MPPLPDAVAAQIPAAVFSGARVTAGLSGGVDSAVAALLLQRAGARVSAVFMRNWRDDDEAAACHDKADFHAAAAVADALGIDLEVADFAAEYRQRVFAPFLQSLRAGATPNPDVLCNAEIKFDAFRRFAEKNGADFVATGHYARIRRGLGDASESAAPEKNIALLKGEDSAKDQSYFLHRLTRPQLARAIFPLGGMMKTETRQLARAAGLPNWNRKDSVGICFIGERPFREFLGRFISPNPGPMVDADSGKRVGTHDGLAFYTPGQRKGLGIGGPGGGWFVAGKNPAENILEVVCGGDHSRLYSGRVLAGEAHWISGAAPKTNWVYASRLRHGQVPASCTLTEADDFGMEIIFAEPQRAPSPGQYAVVYDGNVCLGGGVIVSAA